MLNSSLELPFQRGYRARTGAEGSTAYAGRGGDMAGAHGTGDNSECGDSDDGEDNDEDDAHGGGTPGNNEFEAGPAYVEVDYDRFEGSYWYGKG
jgi:hypothetical protein